MLPVSFSPYCSETNKMYCLCIGMCASSSDKRPCLSLRWKNERILKDFRSFLILPVWDRDKNHLKIFNIRPMFWYWHWRWQLFVLSSLFFNVFLIFTSFFFIPIFIISSSVCLALTCFATFMADERIAHKIMMNRLISIYLNDWQELLIKWYWIECCWNGLRQIVMCIKRHLKTNGNSRKWWWRC